MKGRWSVPIRPALAQSSVGVLMATVVCALATLIAADLTAEPPVVRYLDGPPPGFSGGFGEQSCHACHFSAEVNDGEGVLSIGGIPDHYSPGERYELVVTLTRPEMVLGGFQLSARHADGGSQAGEMRAEESEEARVAFGEREDIQYAFQSAVGAHPSAKGMSRWTVEWIAPADGEVHFHVAANAANGDDTAEGDFVYTSVGSTLPENP